MKIGLKKLIGFFLSEKGVPAFAGLVGVLIGGLLNLWGNYMLNNRLATQQIGQMRLVAALQMQQLVFDRKLTTLKSFNLALGVASSEIIPEIYKLNGRVGVQLSLPEISKEESERILLDANSLQAKALKWITEVESEGVVLEALCGEKSPNLSMSFSMPTIEQFQNPNARRPVLEIVKKGNESLLQKIVEINHQGNAFSDKVSATLQPSHF